MDNMFNFKTLSKSLILPHIRIFHILLLAAILAALAAPSALSVVSAQQDESPWYEVRAIYTADYGVNVPSGIAYSPKAKAFLLWESGGDVTGIGMNEDGVNTQNLNIPVEDSRNLAFNKFTNTLFVQSNAGAQVEEFSVNAGGIPVAGSAPKQKYNLRMLNLNQARGMDFWESGMDMKLGDDIYESFRAYQRSLLKEYASMADEFGFRVLDARRKINVIQDELRRQIGAFLAESDTSAPKTEQVT
jgi:hypothetical protein